MIDVNLFLSVLLSVTAIILLIVLIVLGIKLIFLVDRANKVMDNVEDKINSLNGFFEVADRISASLTAVTDTLTMSITNAISKVFASRKNRRKRKKEEEEILDE